MLPLRPRCRHSFEIIAGRLLADDGAQSSVGFVAPSTALAYGYSSRCRTGQEQRSPDGLHRSTAACVTCSCRTARRPCAGLVSPDAALTVLSNVVCSKKPQHSCPHESTPGYRVGRFDQVGLWHGRPSRPSPGSTLAKPARAALWRQAVVIEPTSSPPSCFNT